MDYSTVSAASEIWLYGSWARGDTDPVSDIDVLVAGELKEQALVHVPYPHEQLSIVRYDWRELEHMAVYGSLFLHHVRLEGRPLVSAAESRLSALLETLPRYERADRELASFVTVLDDVERALVGDHSPAFELSVIATALRHACILGCYAIGRPTFGRESAFRTFLGETGFDELIPPSQLLYRFRLYEDGRAPAPFEASTEDVRSWLEKARQVLGVVEECLDPHQ
jgi:predicted nucleotidyltransferase